MSIKTRPVYWVTTETRTLIFHRWKDGTNTIDLENDPNTPTNWRSSSGFDEFFSKRQALEVIEKCLTLVEEVLLIEWRVKLKGKIRLFKKHKRTYIYSRKL